MLENPLAGAEVPPKIRVQDLNQPVRACRRTDEKDNEKERVNAPRATFFSGRQSFLRLRFFDGRGFDCGGHRFAGCTLLSEIDLLSFQLHNVRAFLCAVNGCLRTRE